MSDPFLLSSHSIHDFNHTLNEAEIHLRKSPHSCQMFLASFLWAHLNSPSSTVSVVKSPHDILTFQLTGNTHRQSRMSNNMT